MTTMIITHEVKNGELWAKAWHQGKGSRHELFAKIGVKARTFRDPENANRTGLVLEIRDMTKFQAFMDSADAKTAMREDGLKISSMRVLTEFKP